VQTTYGPLVWSLVRYVSRSVMSCEPYLRSL
jgi:hypothetical protein